MALLWPFMDTANRDARTRLIRQIVIDLSVLTAIGLVLGLLAPLGTGYMSLAARALYWVAMAMAGYVFYRPIGALVLRAGSSLDLPDWFLWTAGVLIASIPMAVLVWIVNAGGGPLRAPPLDVAVIHYLAVSVVGAVITLLFNLLPATRAAPPVRRELAAADEVASPVTAALAQPRFLDRLPPALGSDLLALEMEDHYVRAHTALGSELVLMRMRDAVAELDGLEGAQVHRSWWVARGAVEDVARDGRNVRLKLGNGLEAPVARANVALLRDHGWI